MGIDRFRYDGRRALVVGGASGMGRAVAELVAQLGGEVHVLDVAPVPFPVASATSLDLRDRQAIDDVVDALEEPFHAVFSCSGVSGEPFSGEDVLRVNFTGQRHLLEAAVARGLLPPGAAVAGIASVGGLGWDRNLPTVNAFLDTPDYEAAEAWIADRPDCASYTFSKQAWIVYAGRKAAEWWKLGIRVNTTGPGPTATPLMASTPGWQRFAESDYKELVGPMSTPEQQAYPLAFLNSEAASFVNGQFLVVDGGYVAGGQTGATDCALVTNLAPRLS